MTGAPCRRGRRGVMVEDDRGGRRRHGADPTRGRGGRRGFACGEPTCGHSRRSRGARARSTVIGPAHLGVARLLGCRVVTVYPRTRVGVLSTGDELVEGGRAAAPGQIRESNRPMLLALCDRRAAARRPRPRSGRRGRDHRRVQPWPRRVRRDHHAAVGSAWATSTSSRSCSTPSATCDGCRSRSSPPSRSPSASSARRPPCSALPGNPVSSLVTFELFARPALRQMMGHADMDRPRVTGDRRSDPAPPPRWQDPLPARRRHSSCADGRYHAADRRAQGSHQLGSAWCRPMRWSCSPTATVCATGGRRPRLVTDAVSWPIALSPRWPISSTRHGRTVRDLRISVTDRCNFRCTYCMPDRRHAVAAAASSCSRTRRSSGSPECSAIASASTASASPVVSRRCDPIFPCSSPSWPSCRSIWPSRPTAPRWPRSPTISWPPVCNGSTCRSTRCAAIASTP